MVVSIGARPSFFASAMKSAAARSGGLTCAALSCAARSAASVCRRSRICAATSLRGFFAASRISVTLITWNPAGDRTGSADSSPFFNANAARSKSGSVCPPATQPSSPPLGAEPGSSEFSRATFAKSSPPLTRLRSSAALTRARSSASLPPVSGMRTRMCATWTSRGTSKSFACSV